VRFVIFGAGAIGGVVGARLHQAGQGVQLIARGAHYDAIASRGLTLETPQERVVLPIPVARSPAEAGIGAGDVVLLATKSQDTWGALGALREATPDGAPVVCLQNGVENERVALRLFPDVYGAVVMSPTAHLEPGTVQAYGGRRTGTIDIGRYPSGVDDRCRAVCEALAEAQFDSEPRGDIMRHKYAKLLNNLANAIEAVCGEASDADELAERTKAEGRAVLRAAGIEFEVPNVADVRGRWRRWGVAKIAGRPRGGGSTWQSVVRGAGSVETDYLNGEIVLRGRELGIPTPVNELLRALTHETLRAGRAPGWLTPAEVLARLGPG
jgi:2-dehydropantoate 2-reductase